MGARSFFSESKRVVKPLSAEEVAQVRQLLRRRELLEPDLDAGQVAKQVGLSRRTVLNHIREGTAFPNAHKPAHNKVRIPIGDVEAFKASRRVSQEVVHE